VTWSADVVNELLFFLQQNILILCQDDLVRICVDFYSVEEIEVSRKLLSKYATTSNMNKRVHMNMYRLITKHSSICFNNILSQVSICCFDNNVGTIIRPAWTKASQDQLMHYRNDIDCLLSEVEIPSCLICCNEGMCTNKVHCDEIDNCYDKVTACFNLAINNCIPAEQCKL